MKFKGFFKDNKGAAKWLLPAIIGGIALVVTIIIICVVVNSQKTINLNDYVVITESGYNGSGKISLKIDWDAIKKDHGDDIAFTKLAKDEADFMIGYMSPTDALAWYIEVTSDNASGLSNGDVVGYTFKVNKEWEDYVDCKIKYSKSSYKVKNLEEIETYDAFADLEVVFSGNNGEGVADFTYSGEMLSEYSFSIDKESELSNGDVVTITILENAIESSVSRYEKAPAESEKKYTVAGLSEPIKSLKEISDAQMEELKEVAVNKIKEETPKSTATCSEPEYFGCALTKNEYDGVYKLYIYFTRIVEHKGTKYKLYIPLYFDTVGKNENKISYTACVNQYKNTISWDSGDKFPGSTDIWDCPDCIRGAKVLDSSGEVAKYIGYKYIDAASQISAEYKKEVKAEAEKIAKKFLEESYYYKSIEDFSYFGDCFTNSSYGLIHYTNYYVIYKAKDKRYGDVYLPIAYENLKLLSDGSIVAEEYPYVKTKFLKELFGNIDDMCDSITNGSSAVSGEFSNYFK